MFVEKNDQKQYERKFSFIGSLITFLLIKIFNRFYLNKVIDAFHISKSSTVEIPVGCVNLFSCGLVHYGYK